MSAAPSAAPATVELGGGFIHVRRPDGRAAILVPHLQSAGVAGMMSPQSVNARHPDELRAWLEDWGFEAALPLAQVEQVHGTQIVSAEPEQPGVQADGIMSGSPGIILSVKVADCAPVWLADMSSGRLALVHAGWRGVASGIIACAIDAMAAEGTQASELAVAVGPHLQACCFEVGPEVAQQFAGIEGAVRSEAELKVTHTRDDGSALDLSAALRADLHDLGVREEQIFAATACTRCHPELFHSYRRNGAGGPLMAAVATRRG